LDDRLRTFVFALAEMVKTDVAGDVDNVHGGPIIVAEGSPYAVVAIDRDRILDSKSLERGPDVVDVLLEFELRSVHTDDDQALVLVLRRPGADVGLRALPVDAGIRPEVDKHDLAPQLVRGQGFGVEPPRGAR
jgi:hypothetical protein